MRRTSLALLLLALTPMISRADAPTLPRVKPLHRGVALGLFGEDPGFDYQPLLREIAATGATHVSVVVPYYMHDVRSARIAAHPRFTPDEATVERTLRQASALGLKVLLFPILRLEYQVTPQEWRGSLRPRDRGSVVARLRGVDAGVREAGRATSGGGAVRGQRAGVDG